MVWIEQHQVIVRDRVDHIVGVECIARDITARKNLESQLFQAQKMDALGRLAGGIAHDFNNLLTIITGYAELLQGLQPEGKTRRWIDEIKGAGDCAAGLTKQLLAFSRKQVLEPRIVDPNTVISSMQGMWGRLIGEDIQIELNLQAGIEPVRVDPTQLEQVILNLAINARDAMPKGGRLSIETQAVSVCSENEVHSVRPGDYAMLLVKDTGHGMNTETIAHIFEPFFTTKEVGKGTGLGLATVLGIVEQSDGAVLVDSQPGKGTAFRVYLPAARATTQETKVQSRTLCHRAATGTILVVEDEKPLRELIETVLTDAGNTELAVVKTRVAAG